MLVGILRQRASRTAVAGVVATVGHRTTPGELEQALGQAVSDPTLRVLAWNESEGTFVAADGLAMMDPVAGTNLAMTPILAGDRLLGAIVHDPALLEDPTIMAAGASLTRLVLDNERLARELRGQLEEVRASRARIVEAGDLERRRIERDLHDGVQQRLLALALSMRRSAGLEPDDSRARAALVTGADEAVAVVEEVRELAQGIHPAVLSEAGLGPALGALADRSPVPVVLDLSLDGSMPPTVAATAYFVASEALANVVKHASASAAWIRAAEKPEELRITIEDDGRGGADPRGHGLRGLDDRLSAIGGSLVVRDGVDGGTVIEARIPVP
jgi:signal transduction histidine kinase